MPPPAGTLRVGRYFLALLVILAVLYGIVFWPGQRHSPKLGLDLVGGTQVVYQARTDNGKTPSKSSMQEARQILQERVNAYGVAESTVVIQGDDQIVISIPGKSASDISNIGAAAKLNFRPVVMPPVTLPSAGTSGAARPTRLARWLPRRRRRHRRRPPRQQRARPPRRPRRHPRRRSQPTH